MQLKYFIQLSHILLLLFSTQEMNAQDVYKTPYGAKYHLASCRMVENVSEKIILSELSSYKLTPCKFCKPPQINALGYSSIRDKSVGESVSVQCKAYTQRGTLCKHKTRLANGYCYQHTAQANQFNHIKRYQTKRASKSPSPSCGARTKSGSSCKRKVKGGGYCYQHS